MMAFSTTTARRWQPSPSQDADTPQNSPAKGAATSPTHPPIASSSSCLHAWPSRDAANFTRVPQSPWTKMIRTPDAYRATHDTMPPVQQGNPVGS
ncbi:hypothetical protein Gpo141_00002719 [Globisporangium polare]